MMTYCLRTPFTLGIFVATGQIPFHGDIPNGENPHPEEISRGENHQTYG